MINKALFKLVRKVNKTNAEWERLERAGLADPYWVGDTKHWRLNTEALGGDPTPRELGGL
jgi:hypothetical protein